MKSIISDPFGNFTLSVETMTPDKPVDIPNKGRTNHNKGVNGFTLMELMTVLFIISTIGAGMGFSIFRRIPDYRLNEAANNLYLDFQLAKSNAVFHQESVQITFNNDPDKNSESDNSSYRIFRLGSDNLPGGTGSAADTLIKQVRFSNYNSGVTFGRGMAPEFPEGSSTEFITYSDGFARFGINGSVHVNGYVYLINRNENICYKVGTPTLAGVVRLYKAVNGKWETR
jgi:prepilin-type N-terminal cleavage/methylation domain-containing protein